MTTKHPDVPKQLSIERRKEVQARTGLSRSTIYLRISEGTFPKPVSLGGRRAVGWIESEVTDWLKCQISASREGRAQNIEKPSLGGSAGTVNINPIASADSPPARYAGKRGAK